MSNVLKLSATNYLMWSLQVQALVDGYGLVGHLDGSMEIPSPTVTIDGETTPNLEYTIWKRQDRLIYNALLGAITLPIQPLVSRALTAAHVWETLAATYAKPSRAHIKNLRNQLKLCKASPLVWINSPFLANLWITRIKLMRYLKDYLMSISQWWIRLKVVRYLQRLLRYTRSSFTMKPSWPPLRLPPLFVSQQTLRTRKLSLHIKTKTEETTTTTTINRDHTTTTTTRVGKISKEVQDLTLASAKFAELKDMEPRSVLSS